jgi:hypothetical protein
MPHQQQEVTFEIEDVTLMLSEWYLIKIYLDKKEV